MTHTPNQAEQVIYNPDISEDEIELIDLLEHSAPSVRALKIFDITQVTTAKTLQLWHMVLRSR